MILVLYNIYFQGPNGKLYYFEGLSEITFNLTKDKKENTIYDILYIIYKNIIKTFLYD